MLKKKKGHAPRLRSNFSGHAPRWRSHFSGFTLVELIVVVAIIGIVLAISLPALNEARQKNADVSIKDNLKQVNSQAQIVYTNNGCYADGTTCAPDAVPAGPCPATGNSIFRESKIARQIADAKQASGGGLSSCIADEGRVWAIILPLRSDPTSAWCADSSGVAKKESNGGVNYDQTALDAAIATGACQ